MRRALSMGTAGLLVLATLALVVLVSTGTWRMDPILSGSMRPAFPVGGVVVAERVPVSSIGVGDVVLFTPSWAPGETYVHRIVAVHRAGGVTTIRTKGDANPVPDPAPVRLEGRSIYEARLVFPAVGYVAVWCHSPAGELELACMALAGSLIVAGRVGRDRRGGWRVGILDAGERRRGIAPSLHAVCPSPAGGGTERPQSEEGEQDGFERRAACIGVAERGGA